MRGVITSASSRARTERPAKRWSDTDGARSKPWSRRRFGSRRRGDLAARQELLAEIDAADLIPTPANTSYLGLVYEAMRKSIQEQGMPVVIDYDRGVASYRTIGRLIRRRPCAAGAS